MSVSIAPPPGPSRQAVYGHREREKDRESQRKIERKREREREK